VGGGVPGFTCTVRFRCAFGSLFGATDWIVMRTAYVREDVAEPRTAVVLSSEAEAVVNVTKELQPFVAIAPSTSTAKRIG
jgi:hypothetical protein